MMTIFELVLKGDDKDKIGRQCSTVVETMKSLTKSELEKFLFGFSAVNDQL